ncbi:MAG: molybdopterin-guanine dinucleotide biosynthesis protein A [Cellvibrionaceae bacterium]|jgi:molybdopterin-guanine dinucleotide biosynthesis protein A
MQKDDSNNNLLNDPESIPVVILAGGQSQRLRLNNQYKWQLPFADNGTLLNYIIGKISKQSKHVLINAPFISSEKVDSPGYDNNYNDLNTYFLPIIHDILPNFQGPLAGLLTSLKWAKDHNHPWVMTLACDTPFFPDDLLSQLSKQVQTLNKNNTTSDKLAITVSSQDRIHPTFGLWSTELLPLLNNHIQINSNEKRLRSISLWAQKHAAIIKIKSTHNKSNDYDPFFNINTPDEYQQALTIITNV